MKYIIGALFMLCICAAWINMRWLPQQADFELQLARCERDKMEMLQISSGGLMEALGKRKL